MTRKDYVLIAQAIRSTQIDLGYDLDAARVLKIAAHKLATNLKAENSRFDVETFKSACGL